MMDNVLIFGKNHKENGDHLEVVLKRLIAAEVTLYPEKCKFSKSELKFLGRISHHGVTADPAKTNEMKPRQNVSELRRFVGMTNQLSKYIPCSADLMRPLPELLSSKCTHSWGPSQILVFAKVEEVFLSLHCITLFQIQKFL